MKTIVVEEPPAPVPPASAVKQSVTPVHEPTLAAAVTVQEVQQAQDSKEE